MHCIVSQLPVFIRSTENDIICWRRLNERSSTVQSITDRWWHRRGLCEQAAEIEEILEETGVRPSITELVSPAAVSDTARARWYLLYTERE